MTVLENNEQWTNILRAKGEQVRQPAYTRPSGKIDGYIKAEHPPKNIGAIFKDTDNKFGLFIDMGLKIITNLDITEIGLCDSNCSYEWMSPDVYKLKQRKVKLEIDIQDTQEVFELLCGIPFEQTQTHAMEPCTERHPAIESLISQLQEMLADDDDEYK